MGPHSQTIPIDWWVRAITVSGMTVQVARLLVAPCFPLLGSGRISVPEFCWLDTGAPISVIPFHVHHQRLRWQSLGVQTTWLGQLCDVGRVNVWFSAGP